MQKIYITGSVGSGKSTLARELSLKLNIPHYELDHVVHERISNDKRGNRKRDETKRDKMFVDIIYSDKWIIEDGLRDYFRKGLVNADTIILLDIPINIRKYRIIIRWIKQNLRIEHCTYKPTFTMLRWLLNENQKFENNKKTFLESLKKYSNKLIILNPNKVKEFLVDSL